MNLVLFGTISEKTTRSVRSCEQRFVRNTEDYPGPSNNHPEREEQNPPGRADEGMVKPPARPRGGAKKEKVGALSRKKRALRNT